MTGRPPDRRAYGRAGEAAAERLLRGKGYAILARNHRVPGGELDLVAESGGLVVFVEVKARRTATYGGAVHAVDAAKRRRLVRLAAQYLAQRGIRDRACRFDVILCEGEPGRSFAVEHLENAFEVPADDLRW